MQKEAVHVRLISVLFIADKIVYVCTLYGKGFYLITRLHYALLHAFKRHVQTEMKIRLISTRICTYHVQTSFNWKTNMHVYLKQKNKGRKNETKHAIEKEGEQKIEHIVANKTIPCRLKFKR